MPYTLSLIALYAISLVVFCIVAARLPILSKEAMHRVSSLDGLRGVLATAVMVSHFAISYYWHTTGVWQTTDSRALNNMGAVPVSLFFMITGYLFTAKVYKNHAPLGSDIVVAAAAYLPDVPGYRPADQRHQLLPNP